MLSRVADSLYWLGRYSERAYTNAYIINVQIDQMLELSRTEKQYEQQWHTILSICGYIESYESRYEGYPISQMLNYLISDLQNYNSIDSLLTGIRSNAKNTRDCIPNALFEEWNSLYLANNESPLQAPYTVLATTEYLVKVRKTSLTATGIIDSLMSRDESFLFMKIGKWLERSEKTALIILNLMENEEILKQDFAVTLALQLTNTLDEYTRRSRMRDAEKVLNFLVGDKNCSRSVGYGIGKIKNTIFEIENHEVPLYAQQLFEAIEAIEVLIQQNASDMTKQERKQWVIQIHNQCIKLGPIFSETYYLTEPILVK